MSKPIVITWVILLGLTLLSAVISNIEQSYTIALILVMTLFKFSGIVFQFMELNRAHPFWQWAIGIFLFLFISLTLIII